MPKYSGAVIVILLIIMAVAIAVVGTAVIFIGGVVTAFTSFLQLKRRS